MKTSRAAQKHQGAPRTGGRRELFIIYARGAPRPSAEAAELRQLRDTLLARQPEPGSFAELGSGSADPNFGRVRHKGAYMGGSPAKTNLMNLIEVGGYELFYGPVRRRRWPHVESQPWQIGWPYR